ncbi:MAG: 16S rRNA (guanine(966)-N(2))-methyltransferase RsmD [Chloroflexi bacterium]|nr:16S rRNA (guanine(966)-N(2))-methyltransferase RsmD [Chloroflexota bacterium]MCY3582847.1 16S rRNA (guanine(966)-N(2))-methyltransferase RsmD [Chloroflexota bacterium]MCY3715501.1 16S rRNA (guanine(966)-N(2))-methyltransferase RsmD [Chloroflexota bacterium]MDE2651232.1 16S rRNA (guanine(966)-N(2))-methyltransferase RsmD [Chloroflexota bacterium]MXX49649.1 16S rRNA (guanine(966)-N(2))-methyltransferase RsmD [Chloroflexota bacterium]
MSLRVIAGSARSRKLKAVPSNSTRPIMDRVKEALFSIIGAQIRNAAFLDLFAGTGSVGIEALSRGASHALFVETDRAATHTIRENLRHTKLADKALVIRRSAFSILDSAPDRHYDFIFVAPPQYRGMWLKTLRALDNNRAWHDAGCLIIVQIDPKEHEPALAFTRLRLVDQRVYGRTMLQFWRFADL